MKITELMKVLLSKGIRTTLHFDHDENKCYVNLETQAKSHLYLYENGILREKYNYETQIDLTQDDEYIINDLCYEFIGCIGGRDYYSSAWSNLCKEKNIKL